MVFQDLPRISRAIEDGSFFKNEAYNKAMDDCLAKGTSLHLYGLLSDGGVHSHIEHLFALLQMAKDKGLTKVYIHCFLDGRDVSPTSGKGFVQALSDKCAALGVGKSGRRRCWCVPPRCCPSVRQADPHPARMRTAPCGRTPERTAPDAVWRRQQRRCPPSHAAGRSRP